MPVVFRRQAEDEATAAYRWYEEQHPGLGARFDAALDTTIRRIGVAPGAFPIVHREVRRAVLRQFPYAVYFQIHKNELLVLAVMHGKRHPTRWQERQ